jgi:hypothetical protein
MGFQISKPVIRSKNNAFDYQMFVELPFLLDVKDC